MSNQTVINNDSLVGGWSTYHVLSPKDRQVFEEALNGFVGVSYTPTAVSTQVVAGMNYRFKCDAQLPQGGPIWDALVEIFVSLDGKPSIINIQRIIADTRPVSNPIINVTACDNELILMAYQWDGSFDLCRILSGNNNAVNVTLNIVSGDYQGPQVLNGVNDPLHEALTVTLPLGSYSLQLLGIDWGGPQAFTVNVNGNKYNSPSQPSGEGLVWSPAIINFTIN